MNILASQTSFLVLLFLLFAGAVGSLLLKRSNVLANIWSSLFAIVGSAWGLLFVAAMFISGYYPSFSIGAPTFPLLSLSFNIDKLSAFFVFIISLIALLCSIYGVGYVKHFYKKYSIGVLGFFYNLFILGMFLVVSASNGIFFLIAWEIMSIASYFLVVYDCNDRQNIKAGFLYLIMTQVGTAFIMLAFLILYKFTGSFDFDGIKSGIALIPSSIKNIVFIFAIIGFGTKAGIVPFHIWLPSAHPAAPSHVSALMSGVMIKTGIYMMIRMFLDILQPIPLGWGITVLIIGSISSLLGVLFALTEHDIKRLLAYHSIENIGIILLGLGSALTFMSISMPTFALLGLTAALFHTLNHATFKSLLFLSSGSVISRTHTRNMEEYGGLIKRMPQTALLFLVGSMAISALPPFNGFFSEWLTFQTLFRGIASQVLYIKWAFIFAAGSLAFTGGLALACFVKAFGSTFLARPRSSEASHAEESSLSFRIGMGALAILCILFGVFSGFMMINLEKIGGGLDIFENTSSLLSLSSGHSLSIREGVGSVSAPALFILIIITISLTVFVVKFLINRGQKITIGTTWDCGTNLTPRMEITSTGFSRSIMLIFRGILKPSIQHEIEYHDSESRYLPKSRNIILRVSDMHQSYLYEPLRKIITAWSLWAKSIQGGNTNIYVLYIFIALVAALFFVL